MFKVKISLSKRGIYTRHTTGDIDEIISGLITTLEEIICNEGINKEEILEVWANTNMRDMLKEMEENDG